MSGDVGVDLATLAAEIRMTAIPEGESQTNLQRQMSDMFRRWAGLVESAAARVAAAQADRNRALDLLSDRTREKWLAEDALSRVRAIDLNLRRLGMAQPDPWREGWNRALEVAQDDIRAALDPEGNS